MRKTGRVVASVILERCAKRMCRQRLDRYRFESFDELRLRLVDSKFVARAGHENKPIKLGLAAAVKHSAEAGEHERGLSAQLPPLAFRRLFEQFAHHS